MTTESMLYKLIDAQKPVIEDGIKAVNSKLQFMVLVLPHITSNHLKPFSENFSVSLPELGIMGKR